MQNHIQKVTHELNDELLRERLQLNDEITYQPTPHPDNGSHPRWRVRLELAYDNSRCIGLDINGEVVLGRSDGAAGVIDLFDIEDADHLGVSRRHALLRPTPGKLYILDMDSTNGTWLNGHSIGVNTPYGLSNGDLLTLGRLDVIVKIIDRPHTNETGMLKQGANLAEILPAIGCIITAQRNAEEVLRHALESTLAYTRATEAAVWLVDEKSGKLYLEASLGLDNEGLAHLSIDNTLPGQVIRTGQPQRVARQQGGKPIKIKTGYLVEAVMYVPLNLGGVTIGVLSAAHHKPDMPFREEEEAILSAIASFTATAVQNARLYQATERALTQRAKVLTALNYALSHNLRAHINGAIGYTGLLAIDPTLSEENIDIVCDLMETGHSMSRLIDRLIDVAMMIENPITPHQSCDLAGLAGRAANEMRVHAQLRGIDLRFQIIGDPYLIQGDASHLYSSMINLLDNAIKFSHDDGQVLLSVVYGEQEIAICVRDLGPGIPEEDLPYLFDRFFRSPLTNTTEPGIGLGLELVRSTAEAHRGTVMVHNAQGGGAEFIVKLPGSLRPG